MTLRSTITLCALAAGCAASAAETASTPETLSFNRHIRPILSDKCFACHGPDAHARKAELRLDQPLPETSAQTVLAPGHPEASELVKRILSADSDEQMPPPNQERQLSQDQKDLLAAWVAQGAPFEAHWSYIPLAPVSAIPDATTNPIDTL